MRGKRQNRRFIAILIAVCFADLVVKVLIRGNYCLVPTESLQRSEAGTAETSVYGLVLYREVGIDHREMYRQAVWWYETALLVEWAIGVMVGTLVYVVLRWSWASGEAAPSA